MSFHVSPVDSILREINYISVNQGNNLIEVLQNHENDRFIGDIESYFLNALELWNVSASYQNSDGLRLLDCTTDYNLVKILLDEGADPNSYSSTYPSPLYNACRKNRLDTARLLIKRGALNTQNAGETPRDLLMRINSDLARELIALLDQNETDRSLEWMEEKEK